MTVKQRARSLTEKRDSYKVLSKVRLFPGPPRQTWQGA